jgi:hypothetical protein
LADERTGKCLSALRQKLTSFRRSADVSFAPSAEESDTRAPRAAFADGRHG